MSTDEKKRVANRQKKWAFALRIKELRNQGLSYLKLTDVFHLDRRTVKKYCEMNGPMEQKHRYRTSPVDPFMDHIKHCAHLGKTVKRTVKELRNMDIREPTLLYAFGCRICVVMLNMA
ncbi:MAG: hypothetical protein ABF629_08655 [Sporolactobacillus sp.]